MKSFIKETRWPKLHVTVTCILYWTLFILLLVAAGMMVNTLIPPKWERYGYGITGTIAAMLATWIMLRYENKSFKDYGFTWRKDTIVKFMKGILIGSAIFLLIIIILLLFTDLSIAQRNKPWDPFSAFWYFSIIPLALMEEIAFRSYSFIKLNKIFGLRITQLIVAIAFALYHIIQGWDFQVAFLGPAIWAFVFGLAAIWSKGIAMPTGIHVALNLIQQVLGMKGGDTGSIWELKHKTTASAESISQTDTIGIIIQLFVLVSAILFTEYYLRKTKHSH